MIPTPDEAGPDSGRPADDAQPEPSIGAADDERAPAPTPDRVHAVLAGLTARALQEHAEVYEGLHADLHAALSEIDGA